MTNAEKFKEVFGFELNTETDYYCPFNSTKCDNLPCDACIEKFWQSEYKEPNIKFKEKIANAKPSTWLTDGLTQEEVEQIVDNAKKQARRNCEKCKHRIPTVDIVKCKPVYGCELWDCEFEPKEVEE